MNDDDALARAWRTDTAGPARAEPSATAATRDPEEVWAAVHGELPPERAQAILDAALVDDDALVELRLAFAIADAVERVEALPLRTAPHATVATHRHGPPTTSTRTWTVVLAMAAALALVWIVRPAPRIDDTGAVRDASAAMIVADGTDVLARDACELRWRARHHEGTFDLRVMTESAVVLVQARGLSSPTYVVPTSALVDVPDGAPLLWQVDHVLPDGTRLRSATFSSRLR